eukprot:709731-Pyramimonas_sp.AAC.1
MYYLRLCGHLFIYYLPPRGALPLWGGRLVPPSPPPTRGAVVLPSVVRLQVAFDVVWPHPRLRLQQHLLRLLPQRLLRLDQRLALRRHVLGDRALRRSTQVLVVQATRARTATTKEAPRRCLNIRSSSSGQRAPSRRPDLHDASIRPLTRVCDDRETVLW